MTTDGWGGVAVLSPVLVVDHFSGAVVWVGEVVAHAPLAADAGAVDPWDLAAEALRAAADDLAARLARDVFDVVGARGVMAMLTDPQYRADPDAAAVQVRWQAAYGRPETALALCEAIERRWPGRPATRVARGLAAWRAGEAAAAIADLTWAATWGGGDAEVLYALARALADAGHGEEAASWLAQACSRGLVVACPPATARSRGM
jgi:tetratricopeptide (TPR) repeat protein